MTHDNVFYIFYFNLDYIISIYTHMRVDYTLFICLKDQVS